MRVTKEFILFTIFFIAVLSEDIFSKLHQNDYKLEYIRGECLTYDPEIFKCLKIVTFKYNRTYAATNITAEYKVDLGSDLLDLVIQVYKFASNEYRPFPIRYRVNYCLMLSKNVFGTGSKMHSGKLSACPIKKDIVYSSSNFHPDESQFPPLIPNGQYKVEMTYMIDDREVALQNYYGVIYRPVKIPKH